MAGFKINNSEKQLIVKTQKGGYLSILDIIPSSVLVSHRLRWSNDKKVFSYDIEPEIKSSLDCEILLTFINEYEKRFYEFIILNRLQAVEQLYKCFELPCGEAVRL